MAKDLQLFPDSAAAGAAGVDANYFFIVAVSVFFAAGISLAILYFALRYKRKSEEMPKPIHGSLILELGWTVIPFLIAMVMFAGGAVVFFRSYNPPPSAMEIFIVGKQWMWKTQHPNGVREINELHVPVNRAIKLTMTTEDVIHSYYIPAFRVKKDVVPGQYSTMWFEPTKVGKYHLFCAEYCGTQHSGMIGSVYVMEEADYEAWLSGSVRGETMQQAGERLFNRLGCATCHKADNTGRGPTLVDVFGQPVKLQSGMSVLADEGYLRESILRPSAKTVAGYTVEMPTFQGQISEEGLLQVIGYIKSLSKAAQPAATPAAKPIETPKPAPTAKKGGN
ncbi:MAG TPA: cytochrome c oxidase subunit II [Bryobacteraceae bacterium]|jgi:cytochrome c oxidase subunit II|nr:cytochrome c oxidase subunit II [Bryobacteraceae bacterium]